MLNKKDEELFRRKQQAAKNAAKNNGGTIGAMVTDRGDVIPRPAFLAARGIHPEILAQAS